MLDVSGSMKGPRIAALKTALAGLTGVNTSLTGTYCRFRSREEVTLLPFSDSPKTPVTVTVDAGNPQPSRDKLRAAVDRLKVGGNTAVYDSLVEAYRSLDAAKDKDRFVSIVLMTDGESNRGKDLAAFKKYLRTRGSAPRVAVFPIMLGEAAESPMKELATATGGALWDARNADLTKAFCQIRGYQ